MRMMRFRVPLLLVGLTGLASAQATLVPRRVSKSFAGEIPLLWTLEGQGHLASATLRVLDDRGKEVLPSTPQATRNIGSGLWQAAAMLVPQIRFQALPTGRYTGEWVLEWEVNGKSRRERMETSFTLGESGDGWLQRAFQNQDSSGFQLQAPGQWNASTPFILSIASGRRFRKVRYQLIEDQQELALVPWKDLPLDKGLTWTLPFGQGWPTTSAELWILAEDEKGITWVQAQDVGLGETFGGLSSQKGTVASLKSQRNLVPVQGNPVPPGTPAPTWTTFNWLTGLTNSSKLDWALTNRVATVNVGYVDEERNASNLWPSPTGRPMSLSITGADLLGKPLYTVSYLLAAQASSNTPLDMTAQEALSIGSGSLSLALGAASLTVGNVPAPVIMSPGVVEDFLGKPLAAGYGWAQQSDTAGTIQPASVWTAAPSTPVVGLDAIRQAANLRWRMLNTGQTWTGYSGEPIDLDNTRDPYALTVASQDPLSRTVLSKGIGSLHRDPADAVIVLTPPPMNLTCVFDGALPSWIRVNGRAVVDGANSRLVLQPPAARKTHIGSTVRYRGADPYDPTKPDTWPYADQWDSDAAHLPAGTVLLDMGRVFPGASVSVTVTSTGKAIHGLWMMNGNDNDYVLAAFDAAGKTDAPSVTFPKQMTLKLFNSSEEIALTNPPTPITDADRSFITSLSVNADLGALGLDLNPALKTQPVVPGYSRTQYGTVDIPSPNQGRCTVTMVTDPDGSAVAEVKDPEGRTIYKIVNPDVTYTNIFYTYLSDRFLTSAPAYRGATGDLTNKTNLVTQYCFDSEGHLRAVIPPKGIPPGSWGYQMDDAALDAALGYNPGTGGLTGALASTGGTSPVSYTTFNAYDSSGHLVATYNPDEGLTRFKVDQKGRVQASQTESQRAVSHWTRTLYDQIFRVRAVGECLDSSLPPDSEASADQVVVNPAQSDFSAIPPPVGTPAYSLLPGFVSVNYYDDYGTSDPTQAPELDPVVRALLPGKELWGAFADGHLVRTEDPRTIERYFYDQDGHVVIRWVAIQDGSSQWQHFAIGIFYDFAGRVKRLVYPAGPTGTPLQVVYTYDDLGRLFAVGTPDDNAYFARYAYLPTGEVKAIVYGPGEGFAAKRMLQDPQGWLRALTVQGKAQ